MVVGENRIPAFLRDLAHRARRQFVPLHLAEPRRVKKVPRFIKGVYKGNYFRYKVKPPKLTPQQRFKVPQLPQAPTSATPQAFKVVPGPKVLHPPSWEDQVRAWLKENWGVLFLNFGSICTLIGFTRSDVIELRTLSMIGSLSSLAFQYSMVPRRLPPILWSSLFASVNAIKISQILFERNAQVVLSPKDQQVYTDFFFPHGLTPKQYELVMQSATPVSFKKGQAILRQGTTLDHIYLVVEGSTRAHILGRHLSAVSSDISKKEAYLGGDSGAWIGEMAFLEYCWEKEQKKNHLVPTNGTTNSTATVVLMGGGDDNGNAAGDGIATADSLRRNPPGPRTGKSLYTIVATNDCELLRWSFDDMEALFGRSTDIRAAMTRAMTSAIVGKVINFTVSRKNRMPNWTTWLDEIRYKGSGTYFTNTQQQLQLNNTSDESSSDEPTS